jgi:hypothetical protein
MAERFYTQAEANALLPSLRQVLERIRENQRVLADDKSLAGVREKASHNGGGLPSRNLTQASQGLERDLKQLQEWGIVLRDPIIGLIDFYGQRKGESIFLCWKLGEQRVDWWHPLNTGIAGRQKL